ncbi:MAG TPA: hypothetical protein VFA18_09660 [Gemmataceae bacterium]|nr:hypothetical protein [Gemmataceae bacterium]
MYRARHTAKTSRRQAVILMVVVILLTLFAVIGIAFVFYSSSEATSSRIFREAQSVNDVQADIPPDILLKFDLGQLIYDVDDNQNGASSSLRGHSMARNEFGWDYDQTTPANPNASFNAGAFNGVGKLHYTIPASTPGGLGGQDGYNIANYQYFYNPTNPNPNNPMQSDGCVLDPERPGTPRLDAGTTQAPTLPQSQPYVGGNAPYTYPDMNTMFLAAVAADGTVLQQSFYRPNAMFPQFYNPANTAPWTTAGVGRHFIMRPRPAENPTFPLPVSPGGDVKNLTGSPGTLVGGQLYNEDSFWMDLGFPVQQLPGGGFFKPLFAMLIMDLDNRVNLNAAGNLRASSRDSKGNIQAPYGHGSNQGWGRWEINPAWVLNQTNSSGQPEWFNLLIGNNTLSGRYGKFTAGQPVPQPIGDQGSIAGSGNTPYFYGQVDFDGGNEPEPGNPGGGVSQPYTLPQAGFFSPFPTFGSGWGNGFQPERTGHPLLYDYFYPQGGNTALDVSNMQGLLINMGQQASSNVLGQLCPANFANPTDPATIRRRNLVTTTSFDLDRPAAVPWIWNPNDPTTAYQYPDPATPGALYPGGAPIPFPTSSGVAPGTAPPAGSDFGPDWRGVAAVLGRLDLDEDVQALPNYPTWNKPGVPPGPPPNGYDMSKDPNYQAALSARQQLALRIFQRLVYATGAMNPATTTTAPTQPQFDALRWLAQLSANIVDYLDSDDYSTWFPWATLSAVNPTTGAPNPVFINAVPGLDPVGNGNVYGTELPRVVINEVLAQIENDPNDAAGNVDFNVNFWVELLNPFSNDPTAEEGGTARLQIPASGGIAGGGKPCYQIIIAQDYAASPTQLATDIRAANNVTGAIPNSDNTQVKANLSNWQGSKVVNPFDPNVIQPNNGNYTGVDGQNAGFYVVGPDSTKTSDPSGFPGGVPPTPTNQVPNLSYAMAKGSAPPFGNTFTNKTKHMILLQRLANPYVPYDPVQNPWITVDYLDQIPMMDGRQVIAGNPTNVQLKNNFSYGKTEPFASAVAQVVPQAPQPALTTQPQNTFFRHNGVEASNPSASTAGQTLHIPFNWLPQPDRQLVSPMELLEVSGYKPHELTQTFIQPPPGGGAPVPNQQVAPWFDQSARIYRLFEFLECHDRSTGIGVGGRQVGKININTIYDPETFFALCDPPPTGGSGPNHFTQADVQSLYQALIGQRTPGQESAPSGTKYNVPNYSAASGGGPDAPFWPLSAPYSAPGDAQYQAFPSGIGINSTILRATTAAGTATAPRLLQPASALTSGQPPYVANELLTKIFNNVTTRSNTFAVWITVGFFQVTDPTTSPPTLGPEIGATTNRNIRHQMFAIIDRTNLTLAPSVTASSTPVAIPSGQSSVTTQITLGALSGTIKTNNAAGGTLNMNAPNGTITWQIQPGTSLVVDTGQNQEMVQVQAVDPKTNKITATFLRSHTPVAGSSGYNITIPGNPGPQPSFDHHSPT